MNTPQIPDDDFQRDREVVSSAYASARGPYDGPPPAIDASIRATARRAVDAGPRPLERPWFMRWNKPLSAAAVVMLTASVIFLAIEQDSSLKPAVGLARKESSAPELRADKPVETTNNLATPASPTPPADLVQRDVALPVPKASRARQTEDFSSRDQVAYASSAEQKKRDDAPPPPPQVIVAEATPAAPRPFKSEAPVVANAAPVAPPVYAPAAPPAPAAAAALTPPAAPIASPTPVQVADSTAPPAANAARFGLAKEKGKAAGRAADARIEAEPARTVIAEAKTEKIAVTGSTLEAEQRAAKPTALASAAKIPTPAAAPLAPAQRVAPPSQAGPAPEPAQSLARLRELRALAKWKEFDELLADVEKRWPSMELPADLAAAKREREKAREGQSK